MKKYTLKKWRCFEALKDNQNLSWGLGSVGRDQVLAEHEVIIRLELGEILIWVRDLFIPRTYWIYNGSQLVSCLVSLVLSFVKQHNFALEEIHHWNQDISELRSSYEFIFSEHLVAAHTTQILAQIMFFCRCVGALSYLKCILFAMKM